MRECVFCQIVRRESPAHIVYEDDSTIAFKDINPQAPVHILVIPKRHIRTLLDIQSGDEPLLGHLFSVANAVAREYGIAQRGFRLVMNCGLESGQSVWHIHLHVLGGRKMGWPPG